MWLIVLFLSLLVVTNCYVRTNPKVRSSNSVLFYSNLEDRNNEIFTSSKLVEKSKILSLKPLYSMSATHVFSKLIIRRNPIRQLLDIVVNFRITLYRSSSLRSIPFLSKFVAKTEPIEVLTKQNTIEKIFRMQNQVQNTIEDLVYTAKRDAAMGLTVVNEVLNDGHAWAKSNANEFQSRMRTYWPVRQPIIQYKSMALNSMMNHIEDMDSTYCSSNSYSYVATSAINKDSMIGFELIPKQYQAPEL